MTRSDLNHLLLIVEEYQANSIEGLAEALQDEIEDAEQTHEWSIPEIQEELDFVQAIQKGLDD